MTRFRASFGRSLGLNVGRLEKMSNFVNRGPNNFVILAVISCKLDRDRNKLNWSKTSSCCVKQDSTVFYKEKASTNK